MIKPLIVLGSINADLYIEVPRLPLRGESLRGHNAAIRPGGKGANQAAAAARLGCTVRLVAQVGQDAFAADLQLALEGAGVDCSLLASVPGPTGQAFILLQEGGENSIVLVGGANTAWSSPPDTLGSLLADAGALLLQCEVPEEVNLAAARIAREAGVPIVLDAGGADRAPREELLHLVDIFSPNETELEALTGIPTHSREAVVQAAQMLQSRGVGHILVKLGARGSLLVGPGACILDHPAFPVDVVDTTGAGDCFTAAYVVGFLEGRPENERLRRASAAAALCVTVKGALASMPNRGAVEAFLATSGPSSVQTHT